ncbi:MAG: cytidylate kinase [Rhodospirillaceae bacterium]|nr:cytidylate kinase [Rhodospirillaceae bacterium]
MNKPVIAVDGTAGSGKGTLARRLADHFDYAYLDTGLLYRAVGFLTLELTKGCKEISEDIACSTVSSITPEILKNPLLRSEEITNYASQIASLPAVRQKLIERQQAFAQNPPEGSAGAVLDGRDIGTVICPKAPFKFFLNAQIEVRAARRLKELLEAGETAIHSRVLKDIQERDARDKSRNIAPLVIADDAVTLDTSKMNSNAVFFKALEFINK